MNAYLIFQTFPGVLRKGLRIEKKYAIWLQSEANYHEVRKTYTKGLAADFNRFRR